MTNALDNLLWNDKKASFRKTDQPLWSMLKMN